MEIEIENTTDSYEVGEIVKAKAYNEHNDILPNEELPDENDGSWYKPCADRRHETLIRHLMETYDLQRVYDLGAGDLRLSAALAPDYEVVAYESIEMLAEYAYEAHGQPDIELRTGDYCGMWDLIKENPAVFAAIGITNTLPDKPRDGIAVGGVDELTVYYSERVKERGVNIDD